MFLEMDSDGPKTLEVEILDINRRRFEDDLKLRMLVQTIGIFAIAAVGGPTTRLDVGDAIGIGAKDTEKGFRMHRAGNLSPCPWPQSLSRRLRPAESSARRRPLWRKSQKSVQAFAISSHPQTFAC